MKILYSLLCLLFVSVLVHGQQTTFTPSCAGSNDTAKFTSIITSIGSNQGTIKLPYKNGTRCAVNTLSIPSNITLDNTDGTGIKVNSGQTLTVAGPRVNPVGKTLFYGPGVWVTTGNEYAFQSKSVGNASPPGDSFYDPGLTHFYLTEVNNNPSQILAANSPAIGQVVNIAGRPYGALCDGSTDDTAAIAAANTAAVAAGASLYVPPSTGGCVVGTATITAKVISDGGFFKLTTGQTTVFTGPITAGPWKIFSNATSGLGTVSFAGNKVVSNAYPEWWAANTTPGTTNMQPALTATSTALDSGSGGTVILSGTNYRINSTWTVGSGSQNYINVIGQGPVTSIITYAGATNSIAVSLSNLAYVKVSGVRINNSVARGTTEGIRAAGTGSGTNTFNSVFDRVIIDGFHRAWNTSNGTATSSEITFLNLTLQNCDTGFYNSDFNGLDFTFINLSLVSCTIGMDLETAGVHVLSASTGACATVFKVVNGGNYSFEHVEDEESTGLFLDASSTAASAVVIVRDCNIANGSSSPNTRTAMSLTGGTYTIENNLIRGKVVLNDGSRWSLKFNNNQVIDPNNTFTSTANPANMGPGFRLLADSGTMGQPFEATGNQQYDTDFATFVAYWPSGVGYVDLGPGAQPRGVLRDGKGSDVASATALPAPSGGVFHVTGVTTITSITSTYVPPGMRITIIFDGVLTFTDGSNLKLAGDFVTTANDSISLVFDGSNFYEVARAIN